MLLPGQSREEQVAKLAESMRPWLVECRRDLHMHPELSNFEVRTGKLIAERLKALGYRDVRTGVAGNGVVATLVGGKPGPVVAWRADMDALPIDETNFNVPYKSTVKGVKHACGHDAHTTIGLGLAEAAIRMQPEIPGTIKFIFQPAEEGAEAPEFGAKLMIKEGALDNPKPAAIFAFHMTNSIDAGQVGWVENAASSGNDTVTITFKGKRAHGAYPYQGIDAVAVASQCIVALQGIHSRRINTQDPSVLSLGTIDGGDRRNIIAETVKVAGTVRTFSEANHSNYEKFIRQTLDGCTSAMGASYELDYRYGYPSMNNDPALVRLSLPALERAIGTGNVRPEPMSMASEDFSYFQRVIPGAMFRLGSRNLSRGISAGTHTAEFDIDEESLVVGVKAGMSILLNYLERSK